MFNEIAILDAIQTIRNPLLDKIMISITTLGDAGIIWILLAIVLVNNKKYRRTGIILAVALVVDLILCNILLKPVIARTRPFDINTMVELIVKRPVDYSFPSGHTAGSFAATVGLFLAKNKKMAIGALIISVLIAFSRLYLYVHFLTDVLGGIAAGIVAGTVGYLIVIKVEKKLEEKKQKGNIE